MAISRFLRSARKQLQYALISREIIKPTHPTSSHLKHYYLSSVEQFSPRMYIPLVIFYPNGGGGSVPNNIPQKAAENTQRMKESLSETLTQYYLFAGRLVSSSQIYCNDEGVEFMEARVPCSMSQLLRNPSYDEVVNLVFPARSVWGDLYKDYSSLLVVRVNHFDCGGMAVAVCMSHKIADGCTLSAFLTHWATVTRGTGELMPPHFTYSESSKNVASREVVLRNKDWVTRRFVFNNTELDHLKATAKCAGNPPTRVEAVTALLYKCAVAAARTDMSSFRPSLLIHPVNIRSKVSPPLPQTCVGNILWNMYIPTRNESEMKLNSLINEIKKAKAGLKGMNRPKASDWLSVIGEFVKSGYRIYICSSMCRYPTQQLDFGWGKPSRVSIAECSSVDQFILMDTPSGDGIEAMISLEEQQMVRFQSDKELLQFASLHQSVL